MRKINVDGYEIEINIKGLTEIWLLKNKTKNRVYAFTSFSEASSTKFALEQERPDYEYELLNTFSLKVFHSEDEFRESHFWLREAWGVTI